MFNLPSQLLLCIDIFLREGRERRHDSAKRLSVLIYHRLITHNAQRSFALKHTFVLQQMSHPQAAPNMRDGSRFWLINDPTLQLHIAHADEINKDTTPLTLWSKDSGKDFKVLSGVHVDALHLEDLTANWSCCTLAALPLNKCSWLIHCSTGWGWNTSSSTSFPQSRNQPAEK